MASKLPKSIATMAFMANKNQKNQTPDKSMSDFNIYGDKIVDRYYTKDIKIIKSPKELKKDYEKDKMDL